MCAFNDRILFSHEKEKIKPHATTGTNSTNIILSQVVLEKNTYCDFIYTKFIKPIDGVGDKIVVNLLDESLRGNLKFSSCFISWILLYMCVYFIEIHLFVHL